MQNVFGWSPGKVPISNPPTPRGRSKREAISSCSCTWCRARKAEAVQPSIGLFFTSTPPTRVPIVVKLESKSIDIPAGEANYVVEDSYVLPVDVAAVSVYPHAHYLAKEMRGTATLPDGTEKPLIWIRRWDIRWQDQYRYQGSDRAAEGNDAAMRFTYDNSAANARSPRPPRRVRGARTRPTRWVRLWVEVIPSRSEDAAVLTQDYFRRALATDIASAELQVRNNPKDPAAHNRLALKVRAGGPDSGRAGAP